MSVITPIHRDPRVQRSLENLRRSGFNVRLVVDSDDKALLLVDTDSILKKIERGIEYPHKRIKLVDKYIVIEVFRSVSRQR